MKFFSRALALSLAMTAPFAAQAQTTPPPEPYAAWSQITGSSHNGAYGASAGFADLKISMRVILDTGDATASCPNFAVFRDIGGSSLLQSVTWTKRSNNPDTAIFDLIVCEAPMPDTWENATLVHSIANPSPVALSGGTGANIILAGAPSVGKSGPPAFVAFGDTGCRGANNPRGTQVCDGTPKSWETGFFFEQLSTKAAALSPDFIIHLGDYRYDKEAKYTGHQSWDMWKSDFFQRVRLGLLGQVPWAMVRGNHEECDLAGQGWFFFFGPSMPAGNCATTREDSIARTWYFDVVDRSIPAANPHRFVVLDTSQTVHKHSYMWDSVVEEMSVAVQAAQAPGWPAPAQPSAWFVMHKPLWAADDYRDPPEQADYDTGQALKAALGDVGSTDCTTYDVATCGLKAVLAAHLHIMQNMVMPGAALPQQYVVGNSGVRLDYAVSPQNCTQSLDSLGMGTGNVDGTVSYVRGRPYKTEGYKRIGSPGNEDFGFTYFRRTSQTVQSGWTATAHFNDGSSAELYGPSATTPVGTACLH